MSMTQNVREMMLCLTETGMREVFYDQFWEFIHAFFGLDGSKILNHYVDATDGYFYVPEENEAEFRKEVERLM